MQIKIKINCYLKHIVRIVIFLLSHLLQTSLKCGYRTSFFSFSFFLVGSVTFIIKTKKKNYDRLLEYYKINIQISFKTLKLLILEF